MTDHAHLDDEAISAVLDGEGTTEEAAHVDACATCAARRDALRDASLLVRTPIAPVAPADRDEAVRRALQADAAPANVVPMRRGRHAPAWIGAAAAIAAVVLGVVVVANGTGDDTGSDSATGALDPGSDDAAGGAALPEAAGRGPVDGGDIGAIDVRSLRSTIEAALGARARQGATSSGGAVGGSSSGAASGSGGTTSDDAAATTVAPPVAFDAATCEHTIREGNPDLGATLYLAHGTLSGEPVAVYAFELAERRWVYVVAGDCEIRNQTTYAP
jgi:hypothetical protein